MVDEAGTTEPDSAQPEPAQPEPLTPWVFLGWVSVLSGPLAYAASRLVAETFYGRFQVLPSEVGLGYGTMVAPALVVGALSLRTARSEADEVAHGRPVTPSVLGLPLTTIRAAKVRLTGVDTPAALPQDRCVMLLGSSGGVAVIVDGASVRRVPSDYAMTASGC
jgi:hypothetical protein